MKKQTKLLCIDDDRSIREMIAMFFERLEYTVFTAGDGEEGLDLFHLHKPDIVLVDLIMPKVDGFEVLETITMESPDTPVLVISGEGEMADVIQALRLGAWNYQTKPIEKMAFIQHSVEQALEKAKLIKENKAYQKGLEKKLSTIIENFDGFVFTCDHSCQITYMNPALVSHIGHDATGENCHQTIFGDGKLCPLCVKDVALGVQGTRQEIQSKRDGRWYFAVQSPIVDHIGRIKEHQIILHDITDRKKAILDLEEREAYLRKENLRLKESLSDRYRFGDIIGKSKPMQDVYETIVNAAASDASVIIYGDSGTGKELVARAIHENSDRKSKKLVYVNCGAIPENLIESEFFGYKKGAFTGANKDKHGFLDIADGGTLFLDEIGEIPLNMQVKLLRAVESSGYTPVGSTEVKISDIRIISATNRDLKALARQGLMRQDFLYRIHIIPVHVPPLRDRKEDIPLLLDHFLAQYEQEKIPHITPRITKALQNYDWPGNVRELQNTIHRFITLKKLDFMELDFAEPAERQELDEVDFDNKEITLAEIVDRYEKKVLAKSLEKHNWHKTKVATSLKIDRKTLFNKMKKYAIPFKKSK